MTYNQAFDENGPLLSSPPPKKQNNILRNVALGVALTTAAYFTGWGLFDHNIARKDNEVVKKNIELALTSGSLRSINTNNQDDLAQIVRAEIKTVLPDGAPVTNSMVDLYLDHVRSDPASNTIYRAPDLNGDGFIGIPSKPIDQPKEKTVYGTVSAADRV